MKKKSSADAVGEARNDLASQHVIVSGSTNPVLGDQEALFTDGECDPTDTIKPVLPVSPLPSEAGRTIRSLAVVTWPVCVVSKEAVKFSVHVLFFEGRWDVVSPNHGFSYDSYADALLDAVEIATQEQAGILLHREEQE